MVPTGIDKNNGARKEIPKIPSRCLTLIRVLFVLVNIFFLGNCIPAFSALIIVSLFLL